MRSFSTNVHHRQRCSSNKSHQRMPFSSPAKARAPHHCQSATKQSVVEATVVDLANTTQAEDAAASTSTSTSSTRSSWRWWWPHSNHTSEATTSSRRSGQQLAAGALAALAALQLSAADPSWAVLNSPNAKIPRTAEAALRRCVCNRGVCEGVGEGWQETHHSFVCECQGEVCFCESSLAQLDTGRWWLRMSICNSTCTHHGSSVRHTSHLSWPWPCFYLPQHITPNNNTHTKPTYIKTGPSQPSTPQLPQHRKPWKTLPFC